jgi:hypothetical protein
MARCKRASRSVARGAALSHAATDTRRSIWQFSGRAGTRLGKEDLASVRFRVIHHDYRSIGFRISGLPFESGQAWIAGCREPGPLVAR